MTGWLDSYWLTPLVRLCGFPNLLSISIRIMCGIYILQERSHEMTCGSGLLRKFESETSIHFSRPKDIEKDPVVVFAELSICLNCS